MGRSRMIAALVSVGALALAGCSSGGGSKSSTSSTSPEASAATTTTGAASAQSVTITPSTGLTDGQTVQVVGKVWVVLVLVTCW
jgi:peptide/nickel transport system substrate-binding protein